MKTTVEVATALLNDAKKIAATANLGSAGEVVTHSIYSRGTELFTPFRAHWYYQCRGGFLWMVMRFLSMLM
jgi:hypothetical protein